MKFSNELREKSSHIWKQILKHPFIREMVDGTLPIEKFQYYIIQDYGYLLEFVKCLGIAITKAEKFDHMIYASNLVQGCITYEASMLEKISSELKIPFKKNGEINLAPTNFSYTRHLLTVAYSGTFYENISALLPCMWSYKIIGEEKKPLIKSNVNKHYREWIEAYASPNYDNLVKVYLNIIDEAGEVTGKMIRKKMFDNFIISSNYEYFFWDMAYKMEKWLI
ncbi:thiaminase II [Candidatus Bathyarchaeota archaeon]|nr:thiaminase II [Candidatus Bathyarchaeota archaeon]